MGSVPMRPDPKPITWLQRWQDAEYLDREHARVETAREAHIEALAEELPEPGEPRPSRPVSKSSTVAQVMAALDIEPQEAYIGSEEPQVPQEPVGTPDDPYGAQAGRKRQSADERNRQDRERRLRARQAAERAEPGRRWTGFRPKA